MEKLNKIENFFIASLIFILFIGFIITALHDEGQKRIIQMQQVIEISGACSDSEVEEVGSLFGVKPTLENDYKFWEVVKIGLHDFNDPSPVKIANVIVDIKANEK